MKKYPNQCCCFFFLHLMATRSGVTYEEFFGNRSLFSRKRSENGLTFSNKRNYMHIINFNDILYSVGRSVGMSVSLNLVQLITQERFTREALNLVGR